MYTVINQGANSYRSTVRKGLILLQSGERGLKELEMVDGDLKERMSSLAVELAEQRVSTLSQVEGSV